MKKIFSLLFVITLAMWLAATLSTPAYAQVSPPSSPDETWQPPQEGTESVAPRVGVESFQQTSPNASLSLINPVPVPPGPAGTILNAYLVNAYGQPISTLTADQECYLLVSFNSAGYFYLWEYYPSGTSPYGHWLCYRWFRPSAGIWRIGPFQAGAMDPNGRYVWRMWYLSGGYWSTRSLSFTYTRSYTPATISSFTASPASIQAGQTATLTWSTTNASSVTISGIGSVGTSGSTTVTPSSTTSYTLTATGDSGTTPATLSATVTVQPKIPPTFSTSQSSIQSGQSTTLSWNAPWATQVSISGISGTFASSGSTTVSPDRTTNYVLTAIYSDGTSLSSSATVNVEQPPYLLYGLIGLLALAAIVIIALLARRPAAAPVAQPGAARIIPSATPASAPSTTPASTSVGTSPASTTTVMEATPAKLALPDGTEMLLAGNARAFGRRELEKYIAPDKSSYLSRQHINISYENGQYYIEDRSSTNGTRLNGTEIKGGGKYALKNGDSIDLANVLSITFKT